MLTNKIGRSQNPGVSKRSQDIRTNLLHTVKGRLQNKKVASQVDGKLEKKITHQIQALTNISSSQNN